MVCPDVTTGPVPTMSGCTTRPVGAAVPAAGTVIVGFPVLSSTTVGRPAGGVTVSPVARVERRADALDVDEEQQRVVLLDAVRR